MENEFECLVVKGVHGGHFAEKFFFKLFLAKVRSRLPRRDLAVVTRQQLTISAFISNQIL